MPARDPAGSRLAYAVTSSSELPGGLDDLSQRLDILQAMTVLGPSRFRSAVLVTQLDRFPSTLAVNGRTPRLRFGAFAGRCDIAQVR